MSRARRRGTWAWCTWLFCGVLGASPWPTHLHVFGFGAEPEIYQYEDIEVTATYGESHTNPEALRPPTRRVEFRVLDLKTGRDYLFAAEAVGAAVLGTPGFYPEIEVWSPLTTRRFARCVFRKVGRTYCCSVEETFESDAEDPAAQGFDLVESDRHLRFVGSHAEPCPAESAR